jgi:hypothetical protein
MSDRESNTDKGVFIGRSHWDVPVPVELRAYLCFSRRMDLQLRHLVTRWARAASLQARQLTANYPER